MLGPLRSPSGMNPLATRQGQKIAAFGSSYRVYANPVQELPKAAIFAAEARSAANP